MKDTILQDGKTYHLGALGGYVPERTLLGNPRLRLDFWGNPVIWTDALGNQIVERGILGEPLIPVEYPTLAAARSSAHRVAAPGSGGTEGLVALLPYLLLGGGLYSVFATEAGGFIVAFAAIGLVATFVLALVTDRVRGLRISNGVQVPFYVLSVAWVASMVAFWVQFFYSMNFDVAAVNYLDPGDALRWMGLTGLGGAAAAAIFARAFRSDLAAARAASPTRENRGCVGDMLVASLAPPFLAVAISLALAVLVGPLITLFSDTTWIEVMNRQATVMAWCFVLLGAGIVLLRSLAMVGPVEALGRARARSAERHPSPRIDVLEKTAVAVLGSAPTPPAPGSQPPVRRTHTATATKPVTSASTPAMSSKPTTPAAKVAPAPQRAVSPKPTPAAAPAASAPKASPALSAAQTEAILAAKRTNSIAAIKLYRDFTGAGLREARDAVQQIYDDWWRAGRSRVFK
ncbi:MAG: hypothetical protein WBI91_09330 [Coriobacteriia bacterium]